MNSENSDLVVGLSGQILAEFEDDASQFLNGEPQFVPSPSGLVGPTAGPSSHLPFAPESAAVAKAAWLRVLERFTEPDEGKQRLVAVRGTVALPRGRLVIATRVSTRDGRDVERHFATRVDVSDAQMLFLFWRDESHSSNGVPEVRESWSAVPWADIASIRFENSNGQ